MTQSNRAGARRRHSDSKKAYATSLVRKDGKSVTAAAREAGIHRTTLQRWLDSSQEIGNPQSNGDPGGGRPEWTEKRKILVGAAVTAALALVATLIAGWILGWFSENSARQEEVRKAADLVSVRSGVGYLHFSGSAADAPPDVVINRSGEEIYHVWVEAHDAAGHEVNIDLGSVLGCRWEEVGNVTSTGLRVYFASVVHFEAKGQKWSKTRDGVLKEDDTAPAHLIELGGHLQDHLNGCVG